MRFATVAALVCAGCADSPVEAAHQTDRASVGTAHARTSIVLSAASAELEIADVFQLTASVTNAAGNVTSRTPAWTSSNETVAIVSQNGLIEAIGPGDATITAIVGDVTASVAVSVLASLYDWDVTVTQLVNTGVHGIDGLSATDVWFGCGSDCAMHYDGSGWTPFSVGFGANVYGASVRAPDEVFFAGQTGGGGGHIIRWDGAFAPASPAPTEMFGVWSDAPGSGFACGDGTFIRFAPNQATESINTSLNTSFNSSDRLEQAWGTSATNVYCAGRSGVYRYDGLSFQRVVPGNFADVHGSSASNVWAVGSSGAVHRFHVGAWNPVDAGQGTEDVVGLSVLSEHHAILGTRATRIMRFDGVRWQNQSIPPDFALAPGGLYTPDRRTVFLAGHRISDNRVLIVRGTR